MGLVRLSRTYFQQISKSWGLSLLWQLWCPTSPCRVASSLMLNARTHPTSPEPLYGISLTITLPNQRTHPGSHSRTLFATLPNPYQCTNMTSSSFRQKTGVSHIFSMLPISNAQLLGRDKVYISDFGWATRAKLNGISPNVIFLLVIELHRKHLLHWKFKIQYFCKYQTSPVYHLLTSTIKLLQLLIGIHLDT